MAPISSAPFPVVEMWTTEQVAEYTGIAVRTLEDWRTNRSADRANLIPFVRLSHKTIRYRPQDVVAWVETRVVGAID